MGRIKPKWLLRTVLVALVAAVALPAIPVLAAPPEYVDITEPTGASWLARKPGASVTVAFQYTSNPSVAPTTTRALARICKVGADPNDPGLDTVLVEAWQDLPNGSGLSASINLTIPAGLPEGSYDARVILTNSDGNPVTDWETGAIIVDNSVPDAPTNLGITQDANPGPDGYVNTGTPTFTWTAATDTGNPPSGIAKYWIEIGNEFSWREVEGTSYTVPGADELAPGQYTVRVKAEDKAGNTGVQAALLTFIVDTEPPDAPMLTGEPPFTKGTSNTVEWDAVSDATTGTCEYFVEVSDDDFATSLASSEWIPGTSWTFDDLESGTQYYYRVKARDLAGSESDWSEVESSTQDDAPPEIDMQTVEPEEGSWSNVASLTVSVEVSDDISGVDDEASIFTVDGNPPDDGTQSFSGGVLSGQFSELVTGIHTVYVKAFDNAAPDGNSAEATWAFGVDLIGPVHSDWQPRGWISDASPTVSVNYTADPSGLDISAENDIRLRRSDDGVIKDGTWTATGGPDYQSGTISYVPGSLTDGQWNVGLDMKDRAGNTLSCGWVFLVDTTAPAAPGSPSTTTPTNDATPVWTWGASAGDPVAPDGTNGSGVDHYEVRIGTTVGGEDVLAATNVGNVTTWACDIDPVTPGEQGLADGTYYLQVCAVDVLGNRSAWVGDDTSVVVIDTTEPTLGSNGPTGFINNDSPTIRVSFDDTAGPVKTGYGSTTALDLDSTSLLPPIDEPSVGDLSGEIEEDTSGLEDGSHTVSITVEDRAGNSAALEWTFFVDTTPPTPPTVSADTWTNDTTPTFTFSGASDPSPGSGLAGYAVEIYCEGSLVRGPYQVAYAAGPLSWTLPDADALTIDDTYEIRVWSVDAAGNQSETFSGAYVAIDTVAPELSNESPTDWLSSGDDITLLCYFYDESGLDSDLTEFVFHDADDTDPTNVPIGSLHQPAWGATSGTIWYGPADYADGTWTVEVQAYDRAGNASNRLEWTFQVDATGPVQPGGPVAGNIGDDGRWYINTLRPTFSWPAGIDPPASDGTAGSGVDRYTFQFGTWASKPGSETNEWPEALVDESDIAATPGTSVQQWTPASDLPLSAGVEYSGRVKAFDALGNASEWADPEIVYDPDPPTAPGAPSTTSPTRDATPVWTWAGSEDAISGVALYHIQIRRAGSVDWDVLDTVLDIPDSTSSPGDQTWEQALRLEDGTYDIRVQAVDVAGNYSEWSGIGTVTVDTTPPGVPGMPRPDESPTADDTPTWTWAGVEGAASYNVYLDDELVDNVDEPSYTVPDEDALEDGEHYLQVSSLDALGNESKLSEAGYVVIDTAEPEAPGMLSLPEYTKDDSVTFIWSAVTDAVGYDFSYSVDGGETWDQVADLTVQTYTVDISGAEDGDVIQGKVVAYDAAGNVSDESNVVSTTVDRTGPVVTAQWPTEPVDTNDATPTWEWSGDDGDGCGVAGYWVTLDEDITVWTTDTWFTPASRLEDGDHLVVVVGVDELGNKGEPLVFAVVTTDATPPGVPGMPQTTSPTADATPTWTWAGVEGAASYNVYLDDELVDNVDEPSYTVPDEDALEDGEHYLQVSAIDGLDNESAKSEAGYVVIDMTGPEAPVVMRITPSPSNQTPQVWAWSRPSDATRYDFGESVDGVTPPETYTNVGNVDVYETNFTTDGTHYVMVRAYDALGNVGGWSAAAFVEIDMTPPGVPTNLAVPSPTSDNTPTWTWTASEGDVERYQVSLDGAAPVDVGDATSFTAPALADGVHNLRVRALDDLGNLSAWAGPAEVLVDTVAPIITLINPENGARLNITTASTILAELFDRGSGIDQSEVWLKIDEGEWVAPTAIVSGTLYYVVNLPFEAYDDKWHSIEVKAMDVVGNESTIHACFKVELYREGFGFGRLRFPDEDAD
jgi:hypothetical protein